MIRFAEKSPSAEELTRLHERAHENCFIASSVRTEITVEPPLPSVGEAIAPVLARVPREQQPLLIAGAAAIQRELLAAHPEVADINRSLFAGRPLAEQFRVQAQGERLGAATWRAFASHETDAGRRDTLLVCAELEEASALVLEALA